MTHTTPTLDERIETIFRDSFRHAVFKAARGHAPNGVVDKPTCNRVYIKAKEESKTAIKQAVYAALVEQMPKLTLNEVIEAGLEPTKDEYDKMVWVDKWHKDKYLSVLSAVLGIEEEK